MSYEYKENLEKEPRSGFGCVGRQLLLVSKSIELPKQLSKYRGESLHCVEVCQPGRERPLSSVWQRK